MAPLTPVGELVELPSSESHPEAPCGCTGHWEGPDELVLDTCDVHRGFARRQVVKIARKLGIPLPERPDQ